MAGANFAININLLKVLRFVFPTFAIVLPPMNCVKVNTHRFMQLAFLSPRYLTFWSETSMIGYRRGTIWISRASVERTLQ